MATPTMTLRAATAQAPIVLDGGLATQLERQGHDLSTPLWSAGLLLDMPSEIAEAHRRYFDAGARVAITASYQASFDGFARLGIDPRRAARLMTRSVELANVARSVYDDGIPRWIAASVGPYGAALADGSEYTGAYGVSVDALRRWHRPRIEVLAESQSDVLALETIPCLAEVEALLSEVDGSGVDCWLSVTCRGTALRSGERVRDAFKMAAGVDEVFAVGVNCTDAADLDNLVAQAAEFAGKPVVVYPNSGQGWDARSRRWQGRPTFDAHLVTPWLRGGARLVGGCCQVGPAEIADIAAAVAEFETRLRGDAQSSRG